MPKVQPPDRMLAKLERVETLLEDLLILQACQSGGNRHKIAKLLKVSTARVAKVSTALRNERRKK